MADFSYPSSPNSDDSAVDNLISQAIDLSTLEQIAALNLSLSSDSLLPTDLETRFHKLKSFPGAHQPKKLKTPHRSTLNPENKRKSRSPNQRGKTPTSSTDEDSDSISASFSDEPVKPRAFSERTTLKSYTRSRKCLASSSPAQLSAVKNTNPETRSGTFPSPSISFDSSMEAVSSSFSPPQQTCCFWCSPKKVSRKKSLSSLSLKDRQHRMEKMLKEQEKMISREAEKVLKWAKQASERIDVSSLKDSPGDDEKFE